MRWRTKLKLTFETWNALVCMREPFETTTYFSEPRGSWGIHAPFGHPANGFFTLDGIFFTSQRNYPVRPFFATKLSCPPHFGSRWKMVKNNTFHVKKKTSPASLLRAVKRWFKTRFFSNWTVFFSPGVGWKKVKKICCPPMFWFVFRFVRPYYILSFKTKCGHNNIIVTKLEKAGIR